MVKMLCAPYKGPQDPLKCLEARDTSMLTTSTFPDSADLTSVKGDASCARRKPRSIDAPCFGKSCPIAVQNRALLSVSHFGDGASAFHCEAPKGIRNQWTSQSCNGTFSAGLASAHVWKDCIDRLCFVLACLPTYLSGEDTSRWMDDAVRSGSSMPIDPLLLGLGFP